MKKVNSYFQNYLRFITHRFFSNSSFYESSIMGVTSYPLEPHGAKVFKYNIWIELWRIIVFLVLFILLQYVSMKNSSSWNNHNLFIKNNIAFLSSFHCQNLGRSLMTRIRVGKILKYKREVGNGIHWSNTQGYFNIFFSDTFVSILSWKIKEY